MSTEPDVKDWADLAELRGPVFSLEGRQMIWPGGGFPNRPDSKADARVVGLDSDNVPEMLILAARTEPGPFWPRTRELGTYLGVRVDGALVAMAGERLRPPGWTEISAVCTAPEARGQGHAARLVGALAARVLARGERPFLHVAEKNTGAIALYERLGFKTRRQVTFQGFRTPLTASAARLRPPGTGDTPPMTLA